MMASRQRSAPLLTEALSSLAAEVTELLRKAGEEELASQISTLRVRSRCGCGDDFCATIYTAAGQPAESIDLEPAEGMIILDVDGEEHIVSIEILDRSEYKKAVDTLLSPAR